MQSQSRDEDLGMSQRFEPKLKRTAWLILKCNFFCWRHRKVADEGQNWLQHQLRSIYVGGPWKHVYHTAWTEKLWWSHHISPSWQSPWRRLAQLHSLGIIMMVLIVVVKGGAQQLTTPIGLKISSSSSVRDPQFTLLWLWGDFLSWGTVVSSVKSY